MSAPVNAKQAKAVMRSTLQAQRSGQYVEFVPYASRCHVSGFANATTGQVAAGTDIRFFGGTQSGGANQQGFARQLTAADTVLRAGEASMPAAQEFVGFYMGVAFQPEMPAWISECLGYYSTLSQRRGPTTYDYGLAAHWATSYYGFQAQGAATTVGAQTINQRAGSNLGGAGIRRLAPGSLVALPAKQAIEFGIQTHRSFFATTTGAAIGAGSFLIDNTGDSTIIDGFRRELCGIVSFVLFGYRFSLPG